MASCSAAWAVEYQEISAVESTRCSIGQYPEDLRPMRSKPIEVVISVDERNR